MIVLEAGRRTAAAPSRGNAGAVPLHGAPLAAGHRLGGLADLLARRQRCAYPPYLPPNGRVPTRFARSSTTAAAWVHAHAACEARPRPMTGWPRWRRRHARDGFLVVHRGETRQPRSTHGSSAWRPSCLRPQPLLDAAEVRAHEPLLGDAAQAGFVIPGSAGSTRRSSSTSDALRGAGGSRWARPWRYDRAMARSTRR